MQPGINERRGKGTWLFPGVCLIAVAVLVGAYSNSFHNSFHFDDKYVIETNLYIRSLKNIPLFFRDARTSISLPANAVYRPLVTASLALDYWLGGGLRPPQFHLSQLTMLILLSILLYFFVLRILNEAREHWWNSYAALLAVMVFSLHTTSTETMNLMHVRSELLSVMGVVGSFLIYLYFPKSRHTHLYLVPMAVGALAKTPSVIFAPLFFAYVVFFEERLSLPDLCSSRSWKPLRRAIWKSLPAFVVGVVVFVAVESHNAPTVAYGGTDRLHYLLTQPFVWLHYGRLFVLPVGLTADTDWKPVAQWYDTRVFAGLLFITLLLRLLWVASKTAETWPVAFGLAWFSLALLPTSSVVPLAEVANEHRVFFPYIGLSLATVWGLAVLAERLFDTQPGMRPAIVPAACVVAIIIAGSLAVQTYQRNEVWRTEETLWRDVTRKSPENGRGLMNYGLTQMSQGKYAEAKRLFEQAAIYTPNYASLEINLGIVTDRLGQPEAAAAHFARALELEPNGATTLFYYARWLVERGRSPEAIPHLQRAVSLNPGNQEARYLLMDTYSRAGQTTELKALVLDTLRLVPGDAAARKYLNDRGDVVVPQKPAVASVETDDGLLNTSLRLYQSGDFQGCIDAARKVLELKPDSAEAHNNIAAAYASQRKWDEAIQAAREALRLKPDFQLARNNLAWAEGEKQKADKGVK